VGRGVLIRSFRGTWGDDLHRQGPRQGWQECHDGNCVHSSSGHEARAKQGICLSASERWHRAQGQGWEPFLASPRRQVFWRGGRADGRHGKERVFRPCCPTGPHRQAQDPRFHGTGSTSSRLGRVGRPVRCGDKWEQAAPQDPNDPAEFGSGVERGGGGRTCGSAERGESDGAGLGPCGNERCDGHRKHQRR